MRQGQHWVETYFSEKGIEIIRGTQQIEITSISAGTPDYYIPRYKTFIEEKTYLKNKLEQHQLDACLYIQKIGYPVFIAIRETGAIIPLTEYLAIVKWTKNWSQIMR